MGAIVSRVFIGLVSIKAHWLPFFFRWAHRNLWRRDLAAARNVCIFPTMSGIRPAVKAWLTQKRLASEMVATDTEAAAEQKRLAVDLAERRRMGARRIMARYNLGEVDRIIWPVFAAYAISKRFDICNS